MENKLGNKLLGADIFVALLLVFLLTTGILMINTGMKGIKVALVRIMLSEGVSEGLNPDESPRYVIVSAKKAGNGLKIYVAGKQTVLEDLPAVLLRQRENGVNVVVTQFDKRLPHGVYVTILDIAKQCGIEDVFDAYTKKEGGM